MKGTVLITCLILLQQQTSLHAAPPIEPCPYDSVQVEDTCKCNPKACSKPLCQYELNIATNGTDVPGSCCAIYICEGCTNDTLIEGKCPCAPGAVLNSKGECECIDPHKSLVNNECVCNTDKCELPQICTGNYVPVTEQEGCCSKTKCIRCPDDSFVTNNNDDAVEDKCVCYPCTKKECGPNEKIVIMQRGNGFPGTCCDMYKCERDGSEITCTVGSIFYRDGDIWETSDSQICECQGGISFCSKSDESNRPCHKEGKVYKHNESWMMDSCTNCTCFNGEPKCISHMCEVSEGHLKKPECAPLNCTKVCPDGYKLNKRGCKMCKCNYPYKYDDILQKYNITKNKLKDILDEYFVHSKIKTTSATTTATTITTSSTTVTATAIPTTDSIAANISNNYLFTTPVTELDGCQPLNALQWSIVGLSIIVALVVVILVMRWLSRRKKGSYDTNPARATIYERMNLTKDALFNNNYIGNDRKDKKTIS